MQQQEIYDPRAAEQSLTSLGAMKASALWMTPAAMAGAAKVPPHSHKTCTRSLPSQCTSTSVITLV